MLSNLIDAYWNVLDLNSRFLRSRKSCANRCQEKIFTSNMSVIILNLCKKGLSYEHQIRVAVPIKHSHTLKKFRIFDIMDNTSRMLSTSKNVNKLRCLQNGLIDKPTERQILKRQYASKMSLPNVLNEILMPKKVSNFFYHQNRIWILNPMLLSK